MMEKNISLQAWLADHKRKYAEGVELFKKFAPDDMKRKFLTFFNEVQDAPQFDNHYTVLVNKLTTIARTAGCKAQITTVERLSQTIKQEVDIDKQKAKVIDKANGDKVLKEILVKESEIFNLRDQILALEESEEDKDEEILHLESELEDVNDELQELKDKFEVLRPGAKIVTYSSLPENIQFLFDRVRKITPLYASLFTEMQNESLKPEEREAIAKKVYELWNERAGIWNDIDDWAEGKRVQMKVEERRTEELPTDQVIKGMQIANRIDRLKENIRRTEVSILQHDKNGKLNLKQKAEKRLEEYQKELTELEKMK